MMVIKRLKEYIDLKNINISAFEKQIGMSNNSFRKSLINEGNIGSDKLENILKVYPDLNPTWLLKGEGKMIISDENIGLQEAISKNSIIDLLKTQLIEKDRVISELNREIGRLQTEVAKMKTQK